MEKKPYKPKIIYAVEISFKIEEENIQNRQMSRVRKYIHGCLELRIGRKWGAIANGYRVSFWSNEK